MFLIDFLTYSLDDLVPYVCYASSLIDEGINGFD